MLKKLTGCTREKVIPTFHNEKTIAEEMADFYTEKITRIRDEVQSNSTNYISHPSRGRLQIGKEFAMFQAISMENLKEIMSTMKSKTSRSDPIPTSIVKQGMALLQHVLLHIINSCLEQNYFPDLLKKALVTPVIKDESKNADDFKNYRPVSNLEFLEKLIEKVMYVQLNDYIEDELLHAKHQSSYRKYHSCETALVKVVDDIQGMLNMKMNVALILLDSSLAFDTVDHDLLFNHLENQFSIKDNALKMIKSYLTDRKFSVLVNQEASEPRMLKYGVPQGSILGPLFYLLYTKEIERIIESHGFNVHVYADDCSIYFPYMPGDEMNAERRLTHCLNDIKNWMNESFLKLNPGKTMVKLFTPNNKSEISSFCLRDNGVSIQPSKTVKLLGVTFGPSPNFNEFADKKIQTCNYHLRNLWTVRKSLPHDTRVLLVTNLIISNIDYCNTLLISSPNYIMLALQRILNKAARFIFDIKRRDHVSPYLFRLHMLPVKFRIKFKVCLIAFKVVQGMAPAYLMEKVEMFQPSHMTCLRLGQGRDFLMFKDDLQPHKDATWISEMVSEWNKIPLNIRCSTELDVFKKELKTYYFREAYAKIISDLK